MTNLAAILNLPDYVWILCFTIGVILCIVEAFLPDFGLFGITGIVLLVAGISLSATSPIMALLMLLVVAALVVVLLVFSFRSAAHGRLSRSPLILGAATTKEEGYVGVEDASALLGKAGVVLATLRPAGVCVIDGERVDVVSEGGFIPAKTEVKVVKVEGMRIVVEPVA